ncbi:MAG: ABC transporter permease [Firmicutes bacterium]|nr:ABC transporter permease [Bacillota bacterium]
MFDAPHQQPGRAASSSGGPAWRRRQQLVYSAAGLVALAFFFAFFAWPVGAVLVNSLRPAGSDGLTLSGYVRFLSDSFYLQATWRTISIAAVSTALTLILGYGVALFAATRPRGRAVWLTLAVAPMLVSLVIRLYGWMILLSEQGPVNRILVALGVSPAPLPLLFSRLAVVVGIVHYCLPFMVLTIYSALRRIDPAVREAAATLGADGWYAFRTIVLPLSMPGVIAGTSITFALSASTFVVPLMIGGPRDRMLSNYVHLAVERLGDWEFAAVIAVLMLAMVVVVLAGANRLAARWEAAK